MGLGGAPDKQLELLFAESVISKEKTETNHPVGWGGGVIQLTELIVSLPVAGSL